MVSSDPRYVQTWRSYRRRWVVYGVAFLCSGIYLSIIKPYTNRDNWVLFGLPCLLVLMPILLWVKGIYCPRCNKPFFHAWWNGNGLARRCVHCRLPKYAEYDPDS